MSICDLSEDWPYADFIYEPSELKTFDSDFTCIECGQTFVDTKGIELECFERISEETCSGDMVYGWQSTNNRVYMCEDCNSLRVAFNINTYFALYETIYGSMHDCYREISFELMDKLTPNAAKFITGLVDHMLEENGDLEDDN